MCSSLFEESIKVIFNVQKSIVNCTLLILFTLGLTSCGQHSEQYDFVIEKAKTPTRAQLSLNLPPILYKAVGKSPSSGEIKKWKVRASGNESYNYNSQCGDTLVNRYPAAGDFWMDCPGIYTIERLLNVSQLYNFLADIVYETTINITNGLDASDQSHNRTYTGSGGGGVYTSNVYYEQYDTYNGVNDCIDKSPLSASFYRVSVGSSYSIRWCIYSDGSVEGNYYAASHANFTFSSNDSATIKSIFIEANNAFGEDFSELPIPNNNFRPLEKVSSRAEDEEKSAFRRDHGPWTMSVNYVDEQWVIQYGQELQLYMPCPWSEDSDKYNDNCSDDGYEGQYAAPKPSVMMVSMIAQEPSTTPTTPQFKNTLSSQQDDGIAAMNVIAVDSTDESLDIDAKENNSIWNYRNKLYEENGLDLPSATEQHNPIYLKDENNIYTGDNKGNAPEGISYELLNELEQIDWISQQPSNISKPQ